MISSSLAKNLLLVACVLGGLQGVLFIIGGCLAAHDRNKDLDKDDGRYLVNFFSGSYSDTKYSCGGMRARLPNNAGPGSNFPSKNADCNPKYDKMDRGWFNRVHERCKNDDTKTLLKNSGAYDRICLHLRGYKYVLAISLTTGIGCIVGAATAILAMILVNKLLAFIAGIVFVMFYIIFIVLFSLLWDDVRDFDKHCLNELCKQMRRNGKRSSREVLAYSIICFVFVFGAIVCCILAALGLEDESPDDSGAGPSSAKVVADSENQMREEDQATAREGKEGKEEKEEKEKEEKEKEETKQAKDINSLVQKSAELSEVGKKYLKKFKELNKYIADKEKMKTYAEKKFIATDTDNSGELSFDEFKEFVAGLMRKKDLPAPSDRRIKSMMRRYDKTNSGTLYKCEFQNMLLDIFLESRELLIINYAKNKADSWKPAKVPEKKDTSKVGELDKLLNSSDDFYVVLEEIAKQADKNQNNMLDISESTQLVKMFCERYRLPVLTCYDIIEVMHDMERDVTEYDIYDLRMVAYAIVSIARNLLK